MDCPKCFCALERVHSKDGFYNNCNQCSGRLISIAVAKRSLPRDLVQLFWNQARGAETYCGEICPSCGQPMRKISIDWFGRCVELDICIKCQLFWFDGSEYELFPERQAEKPELEISGKAREAMAMADIESIKTKSAYHRSGNSFMDDAADLSWWQMILCFLGFPIEDEAGTETPPVVTWTLVSVVSVISLLSLFLFDTKEVFQEFGFIPAKMFRYFGITSITAFFLHGGLMHLIGNMYFLLVFGDNVEEELGWKKYLLLLLVSTLLADALYVIFSGYDSQTPCIGASGGISGIIAYYALKFPNAKMTIFVRLYFHFIPVRVNVFVMFLFWVGVQIFGSAMSSYTGSNVAYMAHLGGALAGVILWAIWSFTQNKYATVK
jgi:membrane associated rhomboid family serine protease/Zn-finger nucleic acid-binding protein